jgi:hypothetical protein
VSSAANQPQGARYSLIGWLSAVRAKKGGWGCSFFQSAAPQELHGAAACSNQRIAGRRRSSGLCLDIASGRLAVATEWACGAEYCVGVDRRTTTCSRKGSIIGGCMLMVCGAAILGLGSPALAVCDSLNACIQTVTAQYWVPATRRWASLNRSLARAAQGAARVLTTGRPQAGCETVECCYVPI